jgi:hypothetical protein
MLQYHVSAQMSRHVQNLRTMTILVELYPICLLAVWPVSVSYRHLPVGIFGMVCMVFFVL